MNRHLTMAVIATVGFGLMIVYAITLLEPLGIVAGWITGIGLGMVIMDIWIDWEHCRDDEDEEDDDDESGSFDVGDGEEVQMGPFRMQFMMVAPGGMMEGPLPGMRIAKVQMDESKLPTVEEDPNDDIP